MTKEDPGSKRCLTEVSVIVPRAGAERVLAELLARFPSGLQECPGPDPGTKSFVLHFSRAVDMPDIPGARIRYRTIPKLDWAAEVRKHVKPLEIGDLRVIAPWMDRKGEADLIIDPARAFGTGGHESTRIALRLLIDRLQALSPETVLDVGCGTGILALAALRLGVDRATVCDIDPRAVEAAAKNARANGLEQRMEFHAGDVTQLDLPNTPLVMANLNATIIRKIRETLACLVCSGGFLILSGIYREQVDDVRAALEDDFFEVNHHREGYWSGIAMQRKAASDGG